MKLEKLSKRSASIRSISLALIFMLKMFSSGISSLPKIVIIFMKIDMTIVNKLAEMFAQTLVCLPRPQTLVCSTDFLKL